MSDSIIQNRYFEVKPILDKYPNARYYTILGGRSRGKTYPTIDLAIEDAIKGRGLFVYVRRYKDSLKNADREMLLRPHEETVERLTGGRWNRLVYWRRRIWLECWVYNEESTIWERVERNPEPIGATAALNTWETEKGGDFGYKDGIKNIILDEALSKAGNYIHDEWAVFQNVVSTFVRDRWEFDTKIWLLANPISKWANPYFRNMGIRKNMVNAPGTTEIKYPNESNGVGMSSVFVNICNDDDGDANALANKVHATFFAFEHSKGKSKSITHGFWEMEDSARLPSGVYQESEKRRTVYAVFEEEKLAIDVMYYPLTSRYYLMIYPAREIKDHSYYFILGTALDKYAIVGMDTNHPVTRLIAQIVSTGQVYYSDDSTADAWHGFLIERRRYAT